MRRRSLGREGGPRQGGGHAQALRAFAAHRSRCPESEQGMGWVGAGWRLERVAGLQGLGIHLAQELATS